MCNHFSANRSDLLNYQIAKKLLLNCRGVHMKYDRYLENEKKNQVVKEKSRKTKLLTDETVLVKKEGKDWLEWNASIDTDITKRSLKAEKKEDFTLFTKANAFWKSKTKKEELVPALDVALGKLENDLRIWNSYFIILFFSLLIC